MERKPTWGEPSWPCGPCWAGNPDPEWATLVRCTLLGAVGKHPPPNLWPLEPAAKFTWHLHVSTCIFLWPHPERGVSFIPDREVMRFAKCHRASGTRRLSSIWMNSLLMKWPSDESSEGLIKGQRQSDGHFGVWIQCVHLSLCCVLSTQNLAQYFWRV